MFEFLNLEVESLRRRIVSGDLEVPELADPKSDIFRYRVPLKNRLMDIMTRVRNFGTGQVADELSRQGG